MSVYGIADWAQHVLELASRLSVTMPLFEADRGLASQSVMVVGDDTVVLLDALFTSSTGATEVVAF